MATFKTRELDPNGKMVTSSYEADSEQAVVRQIRDKGHKPVKIEKVTQSLATKNIEFNLFPKKAKSKDLSIFCKQLHTMLHAGMPLIASLDILHEQTDNKTFAGIVSDMSVRVQKGEVLSNAMRAHGSFFPPILISMTASGELTGNLDEVMERMAQHFTKENRINSKIKGAMMYPMILGFASIAAVVILLVKVIPTFTKMFEANGAELPGITQMVVDLSSSLANHWYIYIGVITALVVGFRFFVKTKQGRLLYDTTLLRIPGLRKPIAQIVTSRFTRTMSTLLSSGIPLLTAMNSAANITGNTYVIGKLDDVGDNVRKGIQLAPLLEQVGVFPKMMVSMVGIGEESGSLEEMLEKTAEYYDDELEAALQKLTGMMEPALILVVGSIIGVIIIAMLLPMMSLFSVMG